MITRDQIEDAAKECLIRKIKERAPDENYISNKLWTSAPLRLNADGLLALIRATWRCALTNLGVEVINAPTSPDESQELIELTESKTLIHLVDKIQAHIQASGQLNEKSKFKSRSFRGIK